MLLFQQKSFAATGCTAESGWSCWHNLPRGTAEDGGAASRSLEVGAPCSPRDVASALDTQHPLGSNAESSWWESLSALLSHRPSENLYFGYTQSLGCLHSTVT